MEEIKIQGSPNVEKLFTGDNMLAKKFYTLFNRFVGAVLIMPIAALQNIAKPNIVFILVDNLDELTTPYWDVFTQAANLIRDCGRRREV
jgi:adenylate cyclase